MTGGQPRNVKEVVAQLRNASAEELPALLERYGTDPRSGVRAACSAAGKRLAAYEREVERTRRLYATMRELGGTGAVVGVDEVGRGPIAGPLTVAAVALPPEPMVIGLDDSKKLSPEVRERLAREVRAVALGIGIIHIQPEEIDESGMSASLRKAMAGAITTCGVEPDAILIDGNPVHLGLGEKTLVGGDGKVACIAAASIVAKVTRDAIMVAMESEYPGYGFAHNKGYASADHIEAIRTLGLSPAHRASFCQGLLDRQERLF